MQISFGIFLIVFLIITEILCILFRLTGLSEEKAKFQVISILTGTGFTTRESELITQHPTRRILAQYAMILGYVGLATIISFLATILTNVIKNSIGILDIVKIAIIFIVVVLFLKNKYLMIVLNKLVEKIVLRSKSAGHSKRSIYSLLNQTHGYGLFEILMEEGCIFIGKTLEESELKAYHIQVLNIDKGNDFITFPSADYVIAKGDCLMIYGNKEKVIELFNLR